MNNDQNAMYLDNGSDGDENEENDDSEDAGVPSQAELPSLPPVSANIQAQCDQIAQAPMVPAQQSQCYLCYVERRRHHPEFDDLNKLFDSARTVFDRFCVDGFDAKEALIESFQQYETMRKKQEVTSRATTVTVTQRNGVTKTRKPVIYQSVDFSTFHTHFVKHIKTRTHDTLLKNDEMNAIHDTITSRIKSLNQFINTAIDSKEYKIKSECFVNEMRSLMMINQIMHMPRYADINTPQKTIKKQ